MIDRPEDAAVPGAKATRGDVLTAISDGIVALLKDFYGKGPTRAKTYYQDDLVVCLLRGGFTRVEETLREAGRGYEVIQQRMAFQEVMRDRFQAVIERATGRRVIGFMSGNQQHPDLLCEVFVLAPTDLLDDAAMEATGIEPVRLDEIDVEHR
ncbi:MAG: Na-translocating system protein MpsC family protein [Conexibacter sp.]